MKYVRTAGALLVLLSTTVQAQTPLQGPSPTQTGKLLDVAGEVIATTGSPHQGKPCVQLKVLPDVRYSGGRVWVCDPKLARVNIGDKIHVRGTASDTRLTKMGPNRRVIPLIGNPQVVKFK